MEGLAKFTYKHFGTASSNAGDYNACLLPNCSSFNLFPDLSTAVPYFIGKSFVPAGASCRCFLPALPQRFINLPLTPNRCSNTASFRATATTARFFAFFFPFAAISRPHLFRSVSGPRRLRIYCAHRTGSVLNPEKGPTSRLFSEPCRVVQRRHERQCRDRPHSRHLPQPPSLLLIAFRCDPLQILIAGIDLFRRRLHYFRQLPGVSPDRPVQMSGVRLFQTVGVARRAVVVRKASPGPAPHSPSASAVPPAAPAPGTHQPRQ